MPYKNVQSPLEEAVAKNCTRDTVASYVEKETLERIILEEITLIPQFVVDDDLSSLSKEDQAEIGFYHQSRQVPKERLFHKIEHVHPGTIASEDVQ